MVITFHTRYCAKKTCKALFIHSKIKDMTTLSQLSEQQFKELLDEYFAPQPLRHKMTETEVRNVAEILNEKIDVPFFSEKKEGKILIKIVLKVDTFLYDNLPNEFYDLVRNVDEGIDDAEAKRLIKRLARLANEKVDIPYIPEPFEYIAIRFIIGIVINAARKNWDFLKAKNAAHTIVPPEKKDVKDKDLEALIVKA